MQTSKYLLVKFLLLSPKLARIPFAGWPPSAKLVWFTARGSKNEISPSKLDRFPVSLVKWGGHFFFTTGVQRENPTFLGVRSTNPLPAASGLVKLTPSKPENCLFSIGSFVLLCKTGLIYKQGKLIVSSTNVRFILKSKSQLVSQPNGPSIHVLKCLKLTSRLKF